jgi:hypothetical protein
LGKSLESTKGEFEKSLIWNDHWDMTTAYADKGQRRCDQRRLWMEAYVCGERERELRGRVAMRVGEMGRV